MINKVAKFKIIGLFFLVVSLLAILGLPSAFAQTVSKSGSFKHGQEAIDALGVRLPAVAKKYSKSEKELRNLLLQDKSLHVDDKSESLLYIESAPNWPALTASATTVAAVNATASIAPFPYTDTFRLHSRPGAQRVIYLDFDGYITDNTSWNASYTNGLTITSEPFSIDTDQTTFSTQEQDVIQSVWQRVTEDYAPFDVDVTTEEPGDAAIIRTDLVDQLYGARVVISPTLFAGGAGGIAFLNAFNAVGPLQKPTFVFSTILGNDEKLIAEAASHEVGHNLGLSHDGIIVNGISSEYYGGHNDWAPIMGVGNFNSISQWSKGEYPGATNLQDDIAIIQTFGIPTIADDHGNGIATATSLQGTNINASGLITTRDDVDYFQFITGAGDVTINLNPASAGGNLDLQGTLFDAQGTIVAFIFNQGGLAASKTITLPAGVYYLQIDGLGDGLNSIGNLTTGYSDYGSLGQYTVTGTLVTSSAQAPVAVASALPNSGTSPLTVSFSSDGSVDADGTIVSYNWNFGDGSADSTEPNPIHTYNSVGTFAATLTVTDDSGLTGNSRVSFTLAPPPNQAPIAVAAADAKSGAAPFEIFFSSSASTDPDGTIVSYSWDFGDGTTAAIPSSFHTYSVAGNYTATLTVTDNQGATATSSLAITIRPADVPIVYVQGISIGLVKAGGFTSAKAVVTAIDGNGARLKGINVNVKWSGLTNEAQTGVTNPKGQVTFTSGKTRNSGNFTISVTNMASPNYTYAPSRNVVMSATILQ